MCVSKRYPYDTRSFRPDSKRGVYWPLVGKGFHQTIANIIIAARRLPSPIHPTIKGRLGAHLSKQNWLVPANGASTRNVSENQAQLPSANASIYSEVIQT